MRVAEKIIVTAQRDAADAAFAEIQSIAPGAKPVKFLSPEARLISLPCGFPALAEKLRAAPKAAIFIRHIFPAAYISALREADRGAAWLNGGSAGAAFSVQMRVEPRDGALYARAAEILRGTEETLTARGFVKDDKNPEWVASLFIHGEDLYAGVSACADNLSKWNGGEMRFKKDADFISRAEFKLLEAFEVFGIARGSVLSENARQAALSALDLGAAPGGWTKALLERGYRVTAVDPAEMHERLKERENFTHLKDIAQRLPAGGQYDLIVNDMRMDMFDSCRVMLDTAERLKPNGQAVITLKLSPGGWRKKTLRALELLEKKYRVLGARQLFHNREEVTVWLAHPPLQHHNA
ncbi:MAG: methyltransferase domain-containing protein [Clostridiales bacterium]|jgi:23S rRNA (cytidine2498-2'-O)-methyltransferase|nr:methyltransferase domain-containing protein [Clostridiales bacterium]